jgi:hypothetical protein
MPRIIPRASGSPTAPRYDLVVARKKKLIFPEIPNYHSDDPRQQGIPGLDVSARGPVLIANREKLEARGPVSVTNLGQGYVLAEQRFEVAESEAARRLAASEAHPTMREAAHIARDVLSGLTRSYVWAAERLSRRILKCVACSIEAETGTEEDPHPVPSHFHTCTPTEVSS